MRIRSDLKFGTITDNPLAIGATTINSAQFATLPTVAGADELYLTLDPEGSNREIVRVTAHAAAATSVTVQRGQLGTAAAQHAAGTRWVHTVITTDLPFPCTSTTRPTLGLWAGMVIFETDTKRFYIYDGTAWQPIPTGRRMNAGKSTIATDANGVVVVAHGLGAAPTAVTITLTTGSTAGTIGKAQPAIDAVDATNFSVVFRRADTDALLASNAIEFMWQAMT